MSAYYQNKDELIEILCEKIAYLNKVLFHNTSSEFYLEDIIEAIDFLKDHKYVLTGQGLNQLEFYIHEAEESLRRYLKKS